MSRIKKINKILQEFSLPLIFGVIFALIWANVHFESYYEVLHTSLIGDTKFFGHEGTFHFLFNDIFMVFFFGIAAVEITKAIVPGGELSPLKKAMNPIFACIGGVVGPVAVFFLLSYILNFDNLLAGGVTLSEIQRGWGIPTATDIALAWLLASFVFGRRHPAVSFLLVLAIIDDAIGLAIIAIFYPSAEFAVVPGFLILNVLAIFMALVLRMRKVHNVPAYLLGPGLVSWCGLFFAHLHPALALVFVIPFMPTKVYKSTGEEHPEKVAAIDRFEHQFKYFVDIGLFGFGIANAGVLLSSVNAITTMVLGSLIVGKLFGIYAFAEFANTIGFKFPKHVHRKELFCIGLIAALGLTVALFVAGEAYRIPALQGPAKMGALLSVIIFPAVYIVAKILKIPKIN